VGDLVGAMTRRTVEGNISHLPTPEWQTWLRAALYAIALATAALAAWIVYLEHRPF